MFCPQCGANVSEGFVFCDKCGAPLTQKPQPAADTPTPASPPPMQPPQTPPAPAKKDDTGRRTLITVACAAILIVAGVFLFFLVSGDSSDSGDKEKPSYSADIDPTNLLPRPEKETDSSLPAGNRYAECFAIYNDYVLPYSDSRYYNRGELKNLSDEALEVAYQELHARHGAKAEDTQLQAYFDLQEWYEEANDSYSLNEYEESNQFLLKTCIALRKGSLSTSANPYLKYLPQGTHLHSGSDAAYLTAADLSHLDATALMLYRNELFARHGYIFSDDQLREFFFCLDWYTPKVSEASFSSAVMNEYERGNLELIQIYEQRIKGVSFSPSNPYRNIFRAYDEYIFPNSATTQLSPYELAMKDKDTLCLARNEILARHGYTFKDQDLLEYFLQRDWYQPSTPPGRSDLLKLSSLENENVALIKEAEDNYTGSLDLSSLNTSLNTTIYGTYFSVKIPAYWKTYATCENDGNYIRFRETQSINEGGGHVFTLAVYSDPSEYEYHPSYRFLGYLRDASGNQLYVVSLHPTDVQFSPAGMAMYTMMSSEYERIIETIIAINGYSYFPA